MTQRIWLITGVSSGFGREMTEQLLQRGDRVVGTVRKRDAVADLAMHYPDTLHVESVDATDVAATKAMVDRAFATMCRIDVVISNAGYGLFGAAEELSDTQVDRMIATNLTGSIQFIRAALPHLRRQGGGRVIQISTYGGQVAFAGNSMYHATKWGIEGFVESVAQEVASFGIGMTLVEPGGARTEFRYGSAQVATPMPEYDATPAHAFMRMLDPKNGLAPGDPARMAARIIESADKNPAPLRMVLGTQALESTISRPNGKSPDRPTSRPARDRPQRRLGRSTTLPGPRQPGHRPQAMPRRWQQRVIEATAEARGMEKGAGIEAEQMSIPQLDPVIGPVPRLTG
jgi:NAD(P)-dependent dehydrogenase (short-subunit alcohol dehydrogenase family)